MISRRAVALQTCLVLAHLTLVPISMAQRAVVEGDAKAESDGAPVQFALVRLVRADSVRSRSDSAQQGLTNAQGHYRFSGVQPGRYLVQLLRIGLRPALSPAVQIFANDTIRLDLRVAAQPVLLPPMNVTADVCVTAKELSNHPQLETLWQEARAGASVRTELMARYRYHVLQHEEGYEIRADGPTKPGVVDQPYVSEPKVAVKNAANARARALTRGYYGANDGWFLPSELDVLHEDFLKTHCLYRSAVRADGEVGLRFSPLRARSNFLDARGTIWLDSTTYLARRIEFEYVDGDESRGTVLLKFGDVAVAGGRLRMPVGGTYTLRPSRKNPARQTEGKLTFTYSAFQELPPR